MDQSQARSCHIENKCKDKELRPQNLFGNERMATSLFLMIGGTMDKQWARVYNISPLLIRVKKKPTIDKE